MSAAERDMDLLRRRLGRNIGRRRKGLGVSRAECAARAGVSISEVGAIERGERQPLVSTLLVLAAALDRTPAEILDGVLRPGRPPGGEDHDPRPDAG